MNEFYRELILRGPRNVQDGAREEKKTGLWVVSE